MSCNCCVRNVVINENVNSSKFVLSGTVKNELYCVGRRRMKMDVKRRQCRGVCHQWLTEHSANLKSCRSRGFVKEAGDQEWIRVMSRSSSARVCSDLEAVGRRKEKLQRSVRVERSWSRRIQESGRHVLLRLSDCREAAGAIWKVPCYSRTKSVFCLQNNSSPTDRALCTCCTCRVERFECGCSTELAIDLFECHLECSSE